MSFKPDCDCDKCKAFRERARCFVNRQADYSDEFRMNFSQGDSYFTIWCFKHPPDPHKKGVGHHHLFANGQLCQRSGYESKSFEHAEAFAYWWMKRWSIYIRTGNFPMTKESMNVPDN